MNTIESITSLLLEKCNPIYLKITNDSDQHQGHQKNLAPLSHINIQIITDQFINLSLVKRQQLIYTHLKPAFKEGLHACQLTTKTKDEIHDK